MTFKKYEEKEKINLSVMIHIKNSVYSLVSDNTITAITVANMNILGIQYNRKCSFSGCTEYFQHFYDIPTFKMGQTYASAMASSLHYKATKFLK